MKKWISIPVALLIALSLVMPTAEANAQDPGLSITKVPDKTSASLGDNITYTYVIKNTTNNVTSNLTLTDSKLGSITLSRTSLNPGENVTANATHTVVVSDFPGPITNTATVTGKDVYGNTLTVNASASVTLIPYKATLTIVKTANTTQASPGQGITYTYTINNTGDVTINNLVLTDNMSGVISEIDLASTNITPGQSLTATANYTVTIADLPGPITNIATIQGKDPLGRTVSVTSDPVTVSLTINKAFMTKFQILERSGVPGKGISKAPGLQKQFNLRSRAAERAGKKK